MERRTKPALGPAYTEARELLENKWLERYFAEHKASLTAAWLAASTTDERERLHAQVIAVEEFREKLYAIATKRAQYGDAAG